MLVLIDSSLLVGCLFGGCAILYRKSLSLSVTQLQTCSDRFCALKMQDLSGSITVTRLVSRTKGMMVSLDLGLIISYVRSHYALLLLLCTPLNQVLTSLIIFHSFSTWRFHFLQSLILYPPPLLKLLSSIGQKYRNPILPPTGLVILDFPSECLDCFEPDCSIHKSLIDNYSVHISSTLLCCASRSFPCLIMTPSSKKIVGWNDNARKYKNDSCFWYKVWEEAGCPVSGVLSSIKRSAKRRYKYEVRYLKRRQQYLLRDRLACNKKKDRFLSAVKKVNKPNASLSSIYS